MTAVLVSNFIFFCSSTILKTPCIPVDFTYMKIKCTFEVYELFSKSILSSQNLIKREAIKLDLTEGGGDLDETKRSNKAFSIDKLLYYVYELFSSFILY